MKKLILLSLVIFSFNAHAGRSLECFTSLQVDDTETGIYGLHLIQDIDVKRFSGKGSQVSVEKIIRDKSGQVLAKVAVVSILQRNGKKASSSLAIYNAKNQLLATKAGEILLNRSDDDSLSLDASAAVSMSAQLDHKEIGYSDVSYVDDVQVKNISLICNLR